jgi:thioesterase domain-containing protein
MAQQLCARGEAIELLLLLDTWCPSASGTAQRELLRRRLAPRRLIERSLALLRSGMAFLAELPDRDPGAEPWPVELWKRVTVPMESRRHIETCMRYRPATYSGRIAILASHENLERGLAAPWQRLAAGGAAIYRAPGDHDSYSRKHFQQTAEQLRLCLAEQVEGKGEHGHTDRC